MSPGPKVGSVAGLRWTPRGAVALPDTLQVRIAPLFSRRVQAGAPIPSRHLTIGELEQNFEWFANPGPRGRPISALVLSGVPLDTLAEVGSAVEGVRARSVRRVVVHADAGDVAAIGSSPLAATIDVLAVAVRSVEECAAIEAAPPSVEIHLVIPLEAEILPELERIARAAGRVSPKRITFTWPFPSGIGEAPPPAAEVARAMPRDAMRQVPWTIKGLPPCLLVAGMPEVVGHVGRSSNRWYVDAGHQRDRALLFLPDVVQFAKREGCRFCDLDPHCDGVAERWLRTGLVPALVPIRGTSGPT